MVEPASPPAGVGIRRDYALNRRRRTGGRHETMRAGRRWIGGATVTAPPMTHRPQMASRGRASLGSRRDTSRQTRRARHVR